MFPASVRLLAVDAADSQRQVERRSASCAVPKSIVKLIPLPEIESRAKPLELLKCLSRCNIH